jgi:hypothetical protein
MYGVAVLDDGYEYEGEVYASLTRIARIITGAHWSGPRFFGLIDKVASEEQPSDDIDGDGTVGGSHV